jgi:hypothetical protein
MVIYQNPDNKDDYIKINNIQVPRKLKDPNNTIYFGRIDGNNVIYTSSSQTIIFDSVKKQIIINGVDEATTYRWSLTDIHELTSEDVFNTICWVLKFNKKPILFIDQKPFYHNNEFFEVIIEQDASEYSIALFDAEHTLRYRIHFTPKSGEIYNPEIRNLNDLNVSMCNIKDDDIKLNDVQYRITENQLSAWITLYESQEHTLPHDDKYIDINGITIVDTFYINGTAGRYSLQNNQVQYTFDIFSDIMSFSFDCTTFEAKMNINNEERIRVKVRNDIKFIHPILFFGLLDLFLKKFPKFPNGLLEYLDQKSDFIDPIKTKHIIYRHRNKEITMIADPSVRICHEDTHGSLLLPNGLYFSLNKVKDLNDIIQAIKDKNFDLRSFFGNKCTIKFGSRIGILADSSIVDRNGKPLTIQIPIQLITVDTTPFDHRGEHFDFHVELEDESQDEVYILKSDRIDISISYIYGIGELQISIKDNKNNKTININRLETTKIKNTREISTTMIKHLIDIFDGHVNV